MSVRVLSKPSELRDVDYFHTVSNIIYTIVKKTSRVLDVGCSTGRLGEKLRREKSCYVVGIEMNPERSELARRRLDQVLVGDVEQMNELPFPTESFDTVIFADALEHFKSPDAVLASVSHYVKSGGQGVFSIPNTANWSVRAKLLLGKWDYKDRGLLDSTHLRFYTLRNARRLLVDGGYTNQCTRCTSGWSWLDWRMPNNNLANHWKGLLASDFNFESVKVTRPDVQRVQM